MSDLIQELKRKLVETLDLPDVDPEQIKDDESLFGEGLGLDSIDVLELVVMIEQEYGVKIDNKELGQKVMMSLSSLAEYIESQRSAG